MKKVARKNTAVGTNSDEMEAAVSDSAASAAPPAPTQPAPAPARADNNPRPSLSARDLEKLHRAFEETGNEHLGQVLDRVCRDAECELRGDD